MLGFAGKAIIAALAVWMVACIGGAGQAETSVAAPAEVRAEFRDSSAEFANPERGFYRAASADLDRLSAGEVAKAYGEGYRLIYVRINLEAYRDADIPAAYLERLETAFDAARQGGVKLIVRATYNYPRSETDYRNAQDAPLSRVKSQLLQLKPVLQHNEDVIAFVQAGFIGAWGEWHTSSNGLTEAGNRTGVRDALLDAVPATRMIQFRYPPYIQDWSPELPSLDAALSGAFRLGFHNDCFLASTTDVGTYDEDAGGRARQHQYMDRLGDITVFGGETCNPADDPGAVPRTACTDILGEGTRFNLTYLNDGYYRRLFHDNWTKGGCMAQVRRSLGYRLGLVRASHPAEAVRGGRFAVELVVRNSGWSRVINPRGVEVVLRDPATGAVRRIAVAGIDPRRWLPGTETAVTLDVVLPGDMAVGQQAVWIALPDADGRLKEDARFAIRLANDDDGDKGQVWDAGLGAFALGTRVDIR